MPFFSVVIPAYNAERFIIDALDSVEHQTFMDYETIVVDDGSYDATSKVVEKWAEQKQRGNLRLFRQSNKGIGAARNVGIREATGDFIAFLDADDSWLDRKLERTAFYISQHSEADLICHDEWLVDTRGKRRVLRHGPYTRYEDLLFKGNSVSTSATAIRRSKVLGVGGFCEDLRFNGVEDYDLWLKLARAGCRFAYLREVLGYYRVHGDGISAITERHCENSLNVLDEHLRGFPKHNLYYRYLMRRRRAAIMRSAGRTLMKQHRHKQAKRLLIMALREDPVSWKTWLLGVLSFVHCSL